MTCDESGRVGPWLRSHTSAIGGPVAVEPNRLDFTEPNLVLSVVELSPTSLLLRVELDLEFHRDRAHRRAGDPYILDLALTAEQLMEAADEWDEDLARYPDA